MSNPTTRLLHSNNSNEMEKTYQLDFFCDATSPETTGDPIVVDDFPVSYDIPNGMVFIVRNYESRYLTHTFHKYAGKFIPNVPRWAMRKYLGRSRSVVLDPFVGSGTTLVEALLHGHAAYGLDIDPLARLISKTKTTLLPESRLQELPIRFETQLRKCTKGTHVPVTSNLSHWFTDEAIAELSRIREVVFSYRSEPDVFDFLLVCFSSIVRRVSNADNQTMKTYVSHTNPKEPERAVPLFLFTLRLYASRLVELGRIVRAGGSAEVLAHGDARDFRNAWCEIGLPPIDLAVTSPPYIKSVDYIYNQMAELFWIGDLWGLDTLPKQNSYKSQYIGNDRVFAKDANGLQNTDWPEVDRFVVEVREKDVKLAVVMQRYFRDLSRHFEETKAILRPGAKYVFVVGNSTLAGIRIPTQSLVVAVGARCGLRVVSYFGYEVRNKHMRFPRRGHGGTVDHDWVVIFENDG